MARTRELLEPALAETRRLEALVNDLLAYGRPPVPNPRPIAWNEIAAGLRAHGLQMAGARPVRALVPEVDLELFTDPALLGQALLNLLRNAMEAIPGDAAGVVRVEAAAEGERDVAIAVADDGPGISEEALTKLYEPFFTTKAFGTGLGLAISRRLISSFGGAARNPAAGGRDHGYDPAARSKAMRTGSGGEMTMEPILVVDDDPGFRGLLETILKGEGYHVESAAGVAEAVRQASRSQFHLVLTDLKLPDGDGMVVLRWFRENSPETPVIVVTAFGTVGSAVEAMKLGAYDYLGKPLASPEELRLLVRSALDQRLADSEREVLREESGRRFACDTMIAGDARMLGVLELARKVAPTNGTVLLMGESGTGKEILARCIHLNSSRAGRVFVAVNCAALSPALIESELFGHEKGSFTGAVAQHMGRFERAHGGTLFLDEIGELDGALQSKLLRVLQEKTFERVGGARRSPSTSE